MRWLPVLGVLAAISGSAQAALFVWTDDVGRTHVTDDLERVPESFRSGVRGEGAELHDLWSDGLRGPTVHTAPGSSSREEDRALRLLRGAVDDLRRGESARAVVALESVLRLEPGRPEAHWYLALQDRQRGRFDSAEQHLRAFLASAGDDLAPWRESATRRLRAIEDERRLADETVTRGRLRLVDLQSEHFRISYDSELGDASPDFVKRVLGYLEEARSRVGERLGIVPAEPTWVLLYGRAAYLEAYRHRFSFRTAGFFDGRIHVVSAAHPGGELRSLLHHEYTHAVYRERAGGDRPYWLNEGLAELSERVSRGQGGLTRAELASLRSRIVSGSWIPLHDLGPGFTGLDDLDARVAYLESVAAASWIEEQTQRDGRARLVSLLGDGLSADEALVQVLGRDTDAVDAAVQAAVLAEFPETVPASADLAAATVGPKAGLE